MNRVVKVMVWSLASVTSVACVMGPSQYVPATDVSASTPATAASSVTPAVNPTMRVTSKDLRVNRALRGEAAIRSANQTATQQPNSNEYINAIMTFAYEPGALYQIYSAPLNITDVQFQSGEKIISVAAGDTLRWQVSKTYSGSAPDKVEHIVLKPSSAGIVNSLVVTTDRRTYHLSLHATQNTAMASVRWQYPGDGDLVQDFAPTGNTTDLAIDVNHMDTNYSVKLKSGSKPTWFPKTVFNDGKKTYIQFNSNQDQLPSLFVGSDDKPELVNYRVSGNYFVIDSVVDDAQLRSGQENPVLVQVHYNR